MNSQNEATVVLSHKVVSQRSGPDINYCTPTLERPNNRKQGEPT
jgi:hypothetical protein